MHLFVILSKIGGSSGDIVTRVLDCRIEVSKFELYTFHYVHFYSVAKAWTSLSILSVS